MNEYIARNLCEAAFIYASEIPLITVTLRPASRCGIFHFENKDGIAKRAAHAYYSNASVPGWSLFKALQQLKNEVQAVIDAQ